MTDVRTAAATIVARNYLPAARVLAASYLRCHPGASFTVFVVDADAGDADALAADGIGFLGPHDLDIPADEFGRMAMSYSVTELSTAVKPSVLQRLLREDEVAIYLDPDIEVFAPFADEVAELALEHGIVLTPHVTEPMPRDGLRPSEADIMAAGVFNLGFVGVARSAATFLAFWAERLRHDAISAVSEQLFTDQRWVDNVPALFPNTVVSDPGWNVAYWNVYQRSLALDADGVLTAGGRPVRFLHYSGYRPEQPWLVSTHYSDRPRVLFSEHPVLVDVFDGYRRRLLDAGYADVLRVPYGWAALPDGTRVSPSLRRTFRRAWIDAHRAGAEPPPNPFTAAGAATLLSWATAPATPEQERAGLNPWAMTLWHARGDLQQAFPHPLGSDAEAFRRWCATSGVADGELADGAVAPGRVARTVPVRAEPGVNVLGYLTAELGVGELGRLVHAAVRGSGLPVATTVEESTVVNRTAHGLPADVGLGEPVYGVSVLSVNADMTPITLELHPELGRDRYVVGVWAWELADFPPVMRRAFDLVDEVWTISEFCARSIAQDAPVPVRVFPVPVRDPLDGDPAPERGPDGPTRFLFAFDFNSLFERKNPLGAVAAFQRAFAGRDDVRLTIKSINGDRHLGDRERLRAAVAGDRRIELVERYLDRDELLKLFADADCYVSLHRSEGFGLTVGEAMAHGLPVIVTDYSATSEFVTADTGWLVPATTVAVGPGSPPYPPDSVWADPDLDAAAAAMREVTDDPAEARRRGLAARRHVLATRSMDAAARWAHEHLRDAHASWLARGSRAVPHGAPPAPAAPLRAAREALKWRADADAPSRLPMASSMRRAVLRAIDHYDHHQRTVQGALMDGVEAAVREVAAMVADLDARVAGRLGDLELTVARQGDAASERLAAVEGALAAARGETADVAAAVTAAAADTTAIRAEVDAVAARAAALAARADETDARAAESTATLRLELAGSLTESLAERDRRLSNVEAATADVRRDLVRHVPTLTDAVLRLHERATGAAPAASEAVLTDVGVLRLPVGDTVVLPWLRAYGSWEVDESRLIDLLLPRDGVFVDIGAHVGYFTVRALRHVGPGGSVVAVEPWATALALLTANVEANVPADVAAALTVLPVAAWEADEPLRLALSPEGNTGDNRVADDGEVTVDGVRLDAVGALAGLRVDVVKSDAQGRDQRALGGMTGILRASRPHVVCEFDPDAIVDAGDDPADVLRRYRSWGYQPLQLDGALVDAVEAEGVRVEVADRADRAIVEAARETDSGFTTLWLRPH